MITIDARNLITGTEFLGVAAKQIPFAIALALTRTGQHVKKAELAAIKRTIDRPTRFTLNSLQLTPASKNREQTNYLQAEVWFKAPARYTLRRHYMEPHVEGGGRELKQFEKLLGGGYYMPSKTMNLDRYGNIRGSEMTRILSGVKAFPNVGYMMNQTRISKRRNKRRVSYFLVRHKTGGLVPGVWARKPGSHMGSRVNPVLIRTKAPTYQKRLPYYEVFSDTVSRHFSTEIGLAIDRAMRTAKR